jgi:SapC
MANKEFYKNPVLLNRDTHRNKRIQSAPDYGFAAQANSLYLAAVEFADAAKEYPIVFTTQAGGRTVPMALLGLREDENLLLNAQGQWQGDYVPALIRRYPFVLAELGDGKMGVCIDEGFSGLNETQGERLFDETGQDTPLLKQAVEFLNSYHREYLRTEAFCTALQEAGLLTPMDARAELTDGSKFLVNGLMVVDEKKLLAMPDDRALSMLRSGMLGWVYLHLASLTNLNKLLTKLAQRKAGATKPAQRETARPDTAVLNSEASPPLI